MHTAKSEVPPSPAYVLALVGILFFSWIVFEVFYVFRSPLLYCALAVIAAGMAGWFLGWVVPRIRNRLMRRVSVVFAYACSAIAIGIALYFVAGMLDDLVAHLRDLPRS